jgi:hypothetical protein
LNDASLDLGDHVFGLLFIAPDYQYVSARAAKAVATALPIPLVDPVTSAVLPFWVSHVGRPPARDWVV